jgi:signal transduction histidine kinase
MNNFIDLIKNLPFGNLDLLSVGITIAGILLLGFIIYLNDKNSITNKSFLYLAVATSFWSIFNYLNYQSAYSSIVLIFLRLLMFCAVWFAFCLFRLLYVFPKPEVDFPKWFKFVVIPSTIIVSLLTLTPAVFNHIVGEVRIGQVATVSNGLGIIPFALLVFFLVFGGMFFFIKKMFGADQNEKKQLRTVLRGIIITFTLIIALNFVLPAFFGNYDFISMGALFVFPFIAFTAYAVYKHKTFHVRNIASATLAFLLCLATFIEIIFADSISLMIFRASVFMLVLIISIQFIRNIFSLEVANEQKSEFMSFASHEIRAPITAMKGYASLMLEGDMGEINPKVKDATQKILISSNSVVSLISQYLNKSKMELGELSYTMTEFDMGKMVKDAVQSFQVNADQKGITLTADVDNNVAYNVNADEGKIREVIGNLIDNAVKYTPEKGSAVVSVTQKDGKVLVKVVDTGHGIPKDVIPRLFKKFSRADAQKANLLGTGLGLYLSKTFIDAHKGARIWVESEGNDKGSQFYLELPSKQA